MYNIILNSLKFSEKLFKKIYYLYLLFRKNNNKIFCYYNYIKQNISYKIGLSIFKLLLERNYTKILR